MNLTSLSLFVLYVLILGRGIHSEKKISENENTGEDPVSAKAKPGVTAETDQLSASAVPEITSSVVVDAALHEIVETSAVEDKKSSSVPGGEKSPTNANLPKAAEEVQEGQQQLSSLAIAILESLNSSGLLRDDIRGLLEKNKTDGVPQSTGLHCAILLFNETVDLPLRIKAAAEVHRAYNSLIVEGELISKHLVQFEISIQRTLLIIKEVDGRMTTSVREHVVGPFTYENFRIQYASAALRIQDLNHKATQATREGKLRKDVLVAEIIKYEGLRKCYNLTKELLQEGSRIYLSNPSNDKKTPKNAFEVIGIMQRIMDLYELLEGLQKESTTTHSPDMEEKESKLKSEIAVLVKENDGKLRYYDNLLKKAKVEIEARASQIVEVNNNIIGLRLLNILSHLMIQNEKIRILLHQYDTFVQLHRRDTSRWGSNDLDDGDDEDDDEDIDHDEL